MNKLNYGNFDSTSADIAFSSTNGYTDPASELETRKQLSYPLKEIKDYINNTIPTDTGDNPVQLVVTSNSIGYRTTIGGTVNPIATTSSHSHGNITNAGDITANATIASGDRLIINDESASKVTNSSITFGTATTTFLSNKGTWLPPISAPKGAITTYTATSYVASVTNFRRNSINGVVMIDFLMKFSDTASGTYTRFPMFSGLPKAPSAVLCGTLKMDGTSGTGLIYIGSDGVLSVDVRETSVAGKIGYGYAVYASAEAMTV